VWNGESYFEDDVEIDGSLTVGGRPVLTGSNDPEHGFVKWADSDGSALSTANDACELAGLLCEGFANPDATTGDCTDEQPAGKLFFALCR
jgi:hypothetical protein